MRCAVVRDGLVENIIVAEVTDDAPEGCELIALDGLFAGIGWLWDGETFINPNPEPEEIEPEPEA